MMMLLASSYLSSGQYFQKLFDIDSSYDFGWNIFLQQDGKYFIRGTSLNPTTNEWMLFNMQISSDGDTIFTQNKLQYGNANLYLGYPGEEKILSWGGYIAPTTVGYTYGAYSRSQAGLIKYDAIGDTIFFKTYTDTSLYFDNMLTCAIMPDGGYITGGYHGLDTPSNYPGYIIRTDSMGDTIWTHTYQKYFDQSVEVNSIIPLSDGRIIIGAMSERLMYGGPPHYFGYYDYIPWFILLDNHGNIIRDTLYNIGFQDGGFIYKDMNGGYFSIGSFDSMYNDDPTTIENFPSYIAHLDTNFRITWITSFPYTIDTGHREKWMARQLSDSNYIIVGDNGRIGGNYGWAAKIDRDGNVLWNHFYQSDNINDSYLRDVVENADISLTYIGTSFNDSLPSWHKIRDVWLVGADSNGCENPFCAPTSVKPSPIYKGGEALHVWPSPNNGSFTINVSSPQNEPVQLTITNIVGQKIKEVTTATNKDVEVEMRVPKGMYFVSAGTASGVLSSKVVVQ